MELEVGNEFLFSVEKKIKLPDGEYFILLADFNQKYLLPTEFYFEFNIKVGDKIKCRIDKLNCNGKVFLEPKHPIYDVGDKDVFTFLEIESRLTRKTKDKYLVRKAIGDKTKRAITLIENENNSPSQNEKWFCEINKIKKGELILSPISKL
jgi:hypothetical protein